MNYKALLLIFLCITTLTHGMEKQTITINKNVATLLSIITAIVTSYSFSQLPYDECYHQPIIFIMEEYCKKNNIILDNTLLKELEKKSEDFCYLVETYKNRMNKTISSIKPSELDIFAKYQWPKDRTLGIAITNERIVNFLIKEALAEKTPRQKVKNSDQLLLCFLACSNAKSTNDLHSIKESKTYCNLTLGEKTKIDIRITKRTKKPKNPKNIKFIEYGYHLSNNGK
jgi:hypothetical protein